MSPSERVRAGFALAATIAKDPGAEAACAGMSDALLPALTDTARELQTLSKAERRARIRALTTPEIDAFAFRASGHPRALALLAHSRNSAPTAREWLRELPLPRPGYAAEPSLVAVLSRVAARTQKGGP